MPGSTIQIGVLNRSIFCMLVDCLPSVLCGFIFSSLHKKTRSRAGLINELPICLGQDQRKSAEVRLPAPSSIWKNRLSA